MDKHGSADHRPLKDGLTHWPTKPLAIVIDLLIEDSDKVCDERAESKPSVAKRTLVSVSLFLVVAFAYYKSSVHYVEDSKYSLLMDEAILHHGTPNMLAYQVPRGTRSNFAANGYPWNFALVKGRLIYAFP